MRILCLNYSSNKSLFHAKLSTEPPWRIFLDFLGERYYNSGRKQLTQGVPYGKESPKQASIGFLFS